jgi:uncharacterized protein
MLRYLIQTRASVLAEKRQVRIVANTDTVGRDDIILVSAGIELTEYRRNPVILFQHCADWPIARAVEISVVDDELQALTQFPREGVSARADEIFGLIGEGVVNAVSTGFDTLESEPMDPANPRNGLRITRCELHEISFVSIPALSSAVVTERAARTNHDRAMQQHQRMARLFAAELKGAQSPKLTNQGHRRMAALYRAELRGTTR